MKVGDYDEKDFPDELVNFSSDVQVILNYGKYQTPVLDYISLNTAAAPTWTGRIGESTYIFAKTAGYLYVCTTDNSTTWRMVTSWFMT